MQGKTLAELAEYVGGKVFGDDSPLAAETAAAMGLDLCGVRVRGRGEDAKVAEVIPYPAAPETAPTEEVMLAVAELFLSAH